MQAKELYDNLTTRGFTFNVNGESLFVSPRAGLTPEDANAVREHKQELIALAQPVPFIDERGDLNISLKSNPRYHYWAGGQPLVVTLAEINAPLSAWRFYSRRNGDLLTDEHAKRCKGALTEAGEIVYCAACNYFAEVNQNAA